MDQFFAILLKEGVLGVTACLFIYLYIRERSENRDLHEKRMADMKEANGAYFELSDKAMEALSTQTGAFAALRTTVEQLLRTSNR